MQQTDLSMLQTKQKLRSNNRDFGAVLATWELINCSFWPAKILSHSLAAVKPHHYDAPSDIWVKPMQDYPAFKDDLENLCISKGFPVGHQPDIFTSFNSIRYHWHLGSD